MKRKILFVLSLGWFNIVSAQLVITPGAQLSFAANTQVVLENMDLINNGSFLPGNSNITFSGAVPAAISGTQPIQFYSIEINKGLFSSLLLQKGISVQQTISFSAGFLNLNGFDIDLGSTGLLNGEKESSRVIGDNGGKIVFTGVLNAPSSLNPGNLGAVISSGQNLGNTIIRRGHSSQANAYNNGSSIKRFYEIIPANNAGLNAVLRMHYLDQELNGFDENTLNLWKSANGISWQNIGFTTRSNTLNYIEKTGLADFSRITLSSATNALPVHFILFNANCNNNTVKLTWKTAQEQNANDFQVEKSDDGIRFSTIGSVPASGNSSTEKTYGFTDNSSSSGSVFYRIAETDFDGKKSYTAVNSVQCGSLRDDLRVWPNPVGPTLFVNISATHASPVTIRLFDNKGALVYIQHNALLKGSNQLDINMSNLVSGVYSMAVEWNEGKIQKLIKLVKQ